MTVLEDSSLAEAAVPSEGDKGAVVGCVREGDSDAVCDLDWALAELESRRICLGSVLTSIPNSFPSFRTAVEELIWPGKNSDSSSSRVSKKVSCSSVTVDIFSWVV